MLISQSLSCPRLIGVYDAVCFDKDLNFVSWNYTIPIDNFTISTINNVSFLTDPRLTRFAVSNLARIPSVMVVDFTIRLRLT